MTLRRTWAEAQRIEGRSLLSRVHYPVQPTRLEAQQHGGKTDKNKPDDIIYLCSIRNMDFIPYHKKQKTKNREVIPIEQLYRMNGWRRIEENRRIMVPE